jgi:hypothetical protein
MEFTVRQRISLEQILGQQKGTIAELEAVSDTLKKIRLTDDERDQYLKILPDKILLDLKAIESAAPLSVELEKAERRKLLEIINSFNSFGPDDVEWVMPLKNQLQALS